MLIALGILDGLHKHAFLFGTRLIFQIQEMLPIGFGGILGT
jgi:hypothetical protein